MKEKNIVKDKTKTKKDLHFTYIDKYDHNNKKTLKCILTTGMRGNLLSFNVNKLSLKSNHSRRGKLDDISLRGKDIRRFEAKNNHCSSTKPSNIRGEILLTSGPISAFPTILLVISRLPKSRPHSMGSSSLPSLQSLRLSQICRCNTHNLPLSQGNVPRGQGPVIRHYFCSIDNYDDFIADNDVFVDDDSLGRLLSYTCGGII
ncbi:hypothetical protein FF38_04733 [Lucilia cuprina]|uniref:Uncharacterized protein n=1 Tax=Lucilia cuprina TaxID=7375 RepID=A0A0L0CPX5_LUCCU|nr:hypothetical protein FF38_04733 [Lucilia cuprina]